MLIPGTPVDRYVVQRLLGRGGMAYVYAVKHTVLGTRHALKVLHTTAPGVRERLVREGQVQARLDPAHVVPVTDVLDVNGAPALLMPLVEGCSLAEVLEDRRLTEPEVASL
ncbi:MAG: serine/threonine protein kinase, partial [Kiritimatiellia bacterium]